MRSKPNRNFVSAGLLLAAALTAVAIGVAGSRVWASSGSVDAAPKLRLSLFEHHPNWTGRPEAAPQRDSETRPRVQVAIVIDDMGGDYRRSRTALELPRAVTMSFLPYPVHTPELAEAAAADGHEILVHVPMQPIGPHNPGPMALRVGQTPQQITERLQWALARVPGHTGINNHEGSLFTQDRAGLASVMQILAQDNLFFLDSRTTAKSQGIAVARAYDVPTAGRDIFLDDVNTAPAVDAQLRKLERRAREKGVAIAIGHPRDATLEALRHWTATAAGKGIVLIPVSDAIRIESERRTARASLNSAER